MIVIPWAFSPRTLFRGAGGIDWTRSTAGSMRARTELSLAPVRAGFLIQERPQREILRAGAGSVEKLLDVRICGAPAG
jgi:hypothetical protein